MENNKWYFSFVIGILQTDMYLLFQITEPLYVPTYNADEEKTVYKLIILEEKESQDWMSY